MQGIEPNEEVISLIQELLARWDEIESPDWPTHPSPFAIQRFAFFHQKEMEKSKLSGSESGKVESTLTGVWMYDEYRSFVTSANNIISAGFLGAVGDEVTYRLEVIKVSFEELRERQKNLRSLVDSQATHSRGASEP